MNILQLLHVDNSHVTQVNSTHPHLASPACLYTNMPVQCPSFVRPCFTCAAVPVHGHKGFSLYRAVPNLPLHCIVAGDLNQSCTCRRPDALNAQWGSSIVMSASVVA
jgi:hypothetical protein